MAKAREYLTGAMNAYKENNSEGEFEFMGKAALQGRADAAFNYGAMGNLACCYYNGRGVWQGKVRALYWFAFGAIELHKASIFVVQSMEFVYTFYKERREE